MTTHETSGDYAARTQPRLDQITDQIRSLEEERAAILAGQPTSARHGAQGDPATAPAGSAHETASVTPCPVRREPGQLSPAEALPVDWGPPERVAPIKLGLNDSHCCACNTTFSMLEYDTCPVCLPEPRACEGMHIVDSRTGRCDICGETISKPWEPPQSAEPRPDGSIDAWCNALAGRAAKTRWGCVCGTEWWERRGADPNCPQCDYAAPPSRPPEARPPAEPTLQRQGEVTGGGISTSFGPRRANLKEWKPTAHVPTCLEGGSHFISGETNKCRHCGRTPSEVSAGVDPRPPGTGEER